MGYSRWILEAGSDYCCDLDLIGGRIRLTSALVVRVIAIEMSFRPKIDY